jgi:hypothetical protein
LSKRVSNTFYHFKFFLASILHVFSIVKVRFFFYLFQMFMSFQAMAACPPPGGSRNASEYPLEPKRVKLDHPAKPDRKPRKASGGDKQPNPLISPTEKCKVCGEPAAKHIHYGAVTCFSCRAFFRRSIQNQSCEAYKCRKQGSCEISLKSVRSFFCQVMFSVILFLLRHLTSIFVPSAG